MYSTVQQTAYVVPTSKRRSHPSQRPFDSTVSLTVRGMPNKSSDKNSWQRNYGRSCWTADQSRYSKSSINRKFQGYSSTEPSNTQGQPMPEYSRSYTTITPITSGYTLPSTAGLPRTGQVKLTALHDQLSLPRSTQTRAKTVGVRTNRQSNGLDATQNSTAPHRHDSGFYMSNIGDVTVADLQAFINTEFPETQGLAFNRASQYIRTTTADLIKAHSRPTSQASATALVGLPVSKVRESVTPTPSKGSSSTNGREASNEQITSNNVDISTEKTMAADAEKIIHERVSSALPVTVNIPTS